MEEKINIAEFTTDIVSSYVANNDIARGELPALIHEVYGALSSAINGNSNLTVASSAARAASPIKRSIFPDYLICLEDGKRFKSLKRHLRTAYKLTPELYREKWGLAPDYPMVAPNYALTRSTLAKNIGLGKSSPKKNSL
jgi:predicted transcriptional regulator